MLRSPARVAAAPSNSTTSDNRRQDNTSQTAKTKTNSSRSDMKHEDQGGESRTLVSGIARVISMGQTPTERRGIDTTSLLKRIKRLENMNASYRQDLGVSQDQVATLERNIARKQRRLQDLQREIDLLESSKRGHQARLQQAETKIQRHRDHLSETITRFREILHRSNDRETSLQKKVTDAEAKLRDAEEKLSQVYAAAMPNFAKDVSRDLPDDVVRNDIAQFFQGEFFSWCADVCIPAIVDQKNVARHLRKLGLINGKEAYLNAPQHLQFDMTLPDGSSPLVLLQAALAGRLCDAFLANPFFLAREQQQLKEFEQTLLEGM